MDVEAIPPEILYEIILYLDLKSLLKCSQTTRKLYSICSQTEAYQNTFSQRGLFTVVETNGEKPSPRACIGFFIYQHKIFAFSGHTTSKISWNAIGNTLGDLYVCDIATKAWKRVKGFNQAVSEHNTVLHKDNFYVMGGLAFNGSAHRYSNSMHRYTIVEGDNVRLDSVMTCPFAPRSTMTSVVWKNKIILFAGTQQWEKTEVKEEPPKRCFHVAAVYKDSMYIFGGYTGSHYLNDMWKLNLEKLTWSNLTPHCVNTPKPRSRSAVVVVGRFMLMLSGWFRQGYYQDLHCFDFETLTWTQIINSEHKIPNLSQHSMCVDGDDVYVFGGHDEDIKDETNDLLKFKFAYNLPASYYKS